MSGPDLEVLARCNLVLKYDRNQGLFRADEITAWHKNIFYFVFRILFLGYTLPPQGVWGGALW